MDSWIHGFTFSWIHRLKDSWIHGFMDSWIHGYMDIWLHGSMVPWIHGSMVARAGGMGRSLQIIYATHTACFIQKLKCMRIYVRTIVEITVKVWGGD